MPSKSELQNYARATARTADINPDYFINQIMQESGFNPAAHNDASGADGIAQIVPRFHPGVDTKDPFGSLDYAAELVAANTRSYGSITKALIAYNWGPGNMLNNWDGTFGDLPQETQHYLDIIVGRDKALADLASPGMPAQQDVQIGPVVPTDVVKQTDDWSCSVRASYAALYIVASGSPMSYAKWESIMAPYADSNVGLKDASGNGLALALRSAGVNAEAFGNITLAQVQNQVRLGKLVLIGGRSWGPAGHWALVRGVESDGTLMLANPSPGYKLGGTPITDQLLTSWSKSSWSAVVVEVPSAEVIPTPTPTVDGRDARIAELERQLADCRNLVGNAYNRDGEVRKALTKILDQTYALDSWLGANRP